MGKLTIVTVWVVGFNNIRNNTRIGSVFCARPTIAIVSTNLFEYPSKQATTQRISSIVELSQSFAKMTRTVNIS